MTRKEIELLFGEFREWTASWDNYFADQTLPNPLNIVPKPPHLDQFIEMLVKKYSVTRPD